jgi:hypothetical protein
VSPTIWDSFLSTDPFRCLSQITNRIRAQTTTTINLESVSRFSKKETTLSILFFPSAKDALSSSLMAHEFSHTTTKAKQATSPEPVVWVET